MLVTDFQMYVRGAEPAFQDDLRVEGDFSISINSIKLRQVLG